MKSMKLIGIEEITGKVALKTGLHIGAGDVEMHIGGTDNPVVKHPFTNEPYIPGSSLKGKVRSLLELRSGLMGVTKGSPVSVKDLRGNNISLEQKEWGKKIIKLFGASGADADDLREYGPARVSFSDCFFTEDVRQKIKSGEMVATEIKAENSIDRISSTAKNPRFTERVPANIEFEFKITLKKFAGDEDELEDLLFQGLRLLELDALGGSGSRGYGRVEFRFDDPEVEEKFKKSNPF
ncbi:CRISPR-associated protein, Csm3 family [Desulfonauticus submarinus]|uniref:CRISPR system Cms endoribonuclease Csm3 n=1 Tax=Desulfonauticus submarinus TaxID=206665 RepID=A0A1H0FV34_9BACT|nr:type III-A CRISPR-associated RAMP protein Csm3 [Desulfonauticus submarinus]SDN98431.1 CRISPR-associated protein, Csm3 family [Desulfonauticus submarinus]